MLRLFNRNRTPQQLYHVTEDTTGFYDWFAERLVDLSGVEPLISAMRMRRSTN